HAEEQRRLDIVQIGGYGAVLAEGGDFKLRRLPVVPGPLNRVKGSLGFYHGAVLSANSHQHDDNQQAENNEQSPSGSRLIFCINAFVKTLIIVLWNITAARFIRIFNRVFVGNAILEFPQL